MDKLCECGCGRETRPGKRFVLHHQNAHNARHRFPSPVVRMEENTFPDPNSGCKLFLATPKKIYPLFRLDGKQMPAHVAAWILAGRAAPPRPLILRHKCDTPCCVNVDHLEIGTHSDNKADMAKRGRGTRGLMPYGVARQGSRFQAAIKYRGSLLYLGLYRSAMEAHGIALKRKAELYAAEDANGR